MDLLRIIFAILLPPLGVFLQVGFGGQFWLNNLLTLFPDLLSYPTDMPVSAY